MSDNLLDLIERARDSLAKSKTELAQKDVIIADLTAAITEKNENAELGAAIRGEGKWYEIREAAKEMAVEIAPGKRLGPSQLFVFLRNSRMIMKRRDPKTKWDYHQPYQDQIDAGRMKLEDRFMRNQDGSASVYRTTLISPSGYVHIQKCIKKAIEEGRLDELLAG